MTHIYILLCERGKYYVGKSDNVEARFRQHMRGDGCAWTRAYKPIKILKIVRNTSPFEEDKQVKILMTRHGIENVRGGTYAQMNLDYATTQILKRELYGTTDGCTRCGRTTHFVNECNAYATVDGYIIGYDD